MKITSFLKPAPSWSVEQLRAYLRKENPDDYQLIDVSDPKEYAAGHLPGARWIPMAELEGRLRELDPRRPAIVYGASGLRGRAAANVLIHAGFAEAYFLEGGIHAWRGEVAEGLPQEDFACFAAVGTPAEHIALAWLLEEGTRLFYAGIADLVRDREAATLFRELAAAEEHHKATLLALYEGVTGQPVPPRFPAGILAGEPRQRLMEGGMRVDEALAWTQGKQIRDIIELGIALETNAYDRYLILRHELAGEDSRRVFEVLSDEERRHLRKLTELREHFI